MNLTCFYKTQVMTDFLFLQCGDNPVNTVKLMIQLLPSIRIIIVGSTLPYKAPLWECCCDLVLYK